MAGREIYRVEIPIIVDDQTDKPLQQAERKVSRFEKSVQKTNERIRRIFGREFRLKISAVDKAWPVIRSVQTHLRGLTSRAWTVTLQAKDKITGSINSIISKLTSPLALLGGGAGLYGLGKLTVGAAATSELQLVTLEALLRDAKKAREYMNWAIKEAADTMFSDVEMMAAAMSIAPYARESIDQFKELVKTAEILAAINPAEGLTGAAFSLREALSGDFVSLQERFNLPRNVINDLKEGAKTVEDYHQVVLKAAEHLGFTYELVKKQGQTATGLWNTITGNISELFRRTGEGILESLKPRLQRIADWFDKNQKTVERWKNTLTRLGREGAERILDFFERAFTRVSRLIDDPKFESATFSEKVRMLVSTAMDDIITWLDGPGKEKLTNTFVSLGEASVQAYIAGMKALGEKTIEELKQGNIKGAAIPAAAMWLLGGGALLRGAWGLGKGLFGAGKWALGKLGLGAAGATVAETATTTATAASRFSTVGRAMPMLSRVRPWLGRVAVPVAAGLEAINIARAEDKKAAAILGTGRIAGMIAGGKAGAVAGGAVGGLFGGVGAAPGAVIGGILGGIGGLFGGEMIARRINEWINKVDFEILKKKAGDAWTWIQETINFANLAYGVGYLLGYLESTIFSGEWWQGKWENVRTWAAETWAAMGGIWQSTKETINSTIFNTEWWGTQWGSVKSWTAGKWDEMKTVWENAKEAISSTLFSKDWWGRQWESVKSWASNALSGIVARWESLKASFAAGREAGQRVAATKYAIGGILTRPHLGLVAEAGPEAIIPLSARMRNRAISLWEETGRRLGVRPYAEGGLVGTMTEGWREKIPVSSVPSLALPGPATINLNFDLTGLVRQVVIESREDIDGAVDRITDTIANNLRAVFQNMTK